MKRTVMSSLMAVLLVAAMAATAGAAYFQANDVDARWWTIGGDASFTWNDGPQWTGAGNSGAGLASAVLDTDTAPGTFQLSLQPDAGGVAPLSMEVVDDASVAWWASDIIDNVVCVNNVYIAWDNISMLGGNPTLMFYAADADNYAFMGLRFASLRDMGSFLGGINPTDFAGAPGWEDIFTGVTEFSLEGTMDVIYATNIVTARSVSGLHLVGSAPGYDGVTVANRVATPIPGAALLMGSGLLGLVGVVRRRKENRGQ